MNRRCGGLFLLLLILVSLARILWLQRLVLLGEDGGTTVTSSRLWYEMEQRHHETGRRPLLSNSLPGNPYIVMHYGPAKTGTSTLQNEMTAWKDRIYQLDNILYGGVYYENMTWLGRLQVQKALMDPGFKCNGEMARVRVAWESSSPGERGTLRERIRQIPCVKELRSLLEPYRVNNTSLLFSNEVKSTSAEMRKVPGYSHKVTQDWISLDAALGDEWNFLLVVGFRPYLDWVGSAKSQNEKFSPNKPRLARWPGQGGRHLLPLFPVGTLRDPNETLWGMNEPDILQRTEGSFHSDLKDSLRKQFDAAVGTFQYSTVIYEASEDFIPIRLLHLYDEVPLRTNLLCNIFPNTPRSCKASKENDRKRDIASLHLNQGDAVAERSWYDQLAVEAIVSQHLKVPSTLTRTKLTEKCMWYHQHVLNRTKWDFPVLCPHKEALLVAWDLSWEMEKEFLGENANRTRHMEVFRHFLSQGKHCNIDAKRAVQLVEWKTFFGGIG